MAVSLVQTGRDHAVWAADGFFVKCGSRDNFEIEAWACDRLRELGLPAPRVIALEVGSYLALEVVPGRPLIERPSRRALREFGAALRTLHEQRFPGFGWAKRTDNGVRGGCDTWSGYIADKFSWGLERVVENGVLNTTELDVIRRTSEELVALVGDFTDGRLLHGDLQVGHIFVSGERTLSGIIDWADLHVGDPAWDIAVLSSWAPETVPHVLDGYGADDAFRERFMALWPKYLLCRHVWGYRAGVDEGWDESARVPRIRSLIEQLS